MNEDAMNAQAINEPRLTVFSRYLDEVLQVVSVTAQKNWNITANNLLAAIDSFIKAGNAVINVLTKSDVLLLSDTLSRSEYNVKYLADALVLTDGVVKTALRNKTLGESITLSDALSRTLVLNRFQLEQLVLSDGLLRYALRVQVKDDTLTLLDSLGAAKARVLQLSDQLTLLDNALAYKLRGRTQQDTLTLADVFASGLLRVKYVADNVLLVDSFTKTIVGANLVSRVLSDALTLKDTNVFKDWTVFFSDRATLLDDSTDTVLQANVKTKLLADSIILTSDSGLKYSDFLYTESVQLSDAYSVLTTNHVFRLMNDALALVDSVMVVRARTFVDMLVVDDAQGRYSELVLIAEDDAPLVDSKVIPASGTTQTRNMAEQLTTTDQAAFTSYRNRTQTESLFVLDELSDNAYRFRQFVDSVVLGDNAVFGRQVIRWLSDTLRLVDAFAALTGKIQVQVLSDSLVLSDGHQKYQMYFRALLDQVVLSDAAIFQGRKSIVLDDAVQITDSSQKILLFSRQMQDFISSITDSKLLEKLLLRVDSLTVADQRVSFTTRTRSLVDSLGLQDEVKRALNRTSRLDDSFTVSDELLARFLPLLQYEIRLKLSVAARELELGVDNVTYLRVDQKAMELAVA